MKKRDSELNANWGTICPVLEKTAAYFILTLVLVSCTPRSKPDKGDIEKDATSKID